MTTPNESTLRLCVIGDELAAGAGDPKALGWVGRVLARTATPTRPEAYTLAVPSETTTALAGRWEAEAQRRLGAAGRDAGSVDRRIVVGLGRADVVSDVSLARSRLNLANILDVATEKRWPAFVVGPPPGSPQQRGRIEELTEAFGDVASRRRVPFVDLFTPLENHEQWRGDLAATGTALPSQAGYGLIAWLVLHAGWRRWLGLPEDDDI